MSSITSYDPTNWEDGFLITKQRLNNIEAQLTLLTNIMSQNVIQMQGATLDQDGMGGSVIAPLAGQAGNFLRGDGTWANETDVPIAVDNTVTAVSFSGNGSNLTDLNAENITSGIINSAHLPIATSNTIGGIKIGPGLTINNGVLSADVRSVNGMTGDVLTSDRVNLVYTLDKDEWIDNSYLLTVDGMTATANILISPAPESINEWSYTGVKCISQATNQLTFSCSILPSSDLIVQILILG